MPADRAQVQRFELKYLVSEETALALRRYLRCYLRPDEHAAFSPDYSYPVHSLYLDSPDLETYHAVQAGEKNRYKLRLRYYSAKDSSVFFEIKRRTTDVITKQRARVHRWAVQPLLAGRPPEMKHLAQPSARELHALQEFCRRMHMLGATPRSHVSYQREAWAGPFDCSIRVTFDRQVSCAAQFGAELGTACRDSVRPFEQAGQNVILELKFSDRLPKWCAEMVRIFGLHRGGAPKYALGVYTLGEHRLSNRGVGFKLPAPAVAAPEPTTSTPWRQPEPLAVSAA